MSWNDRMLDRCGTSAPVSTLVLLVGCILVTLVTEVHSNVTLLKYVLGMTGWALLDGEIEPESRLLNYFSIRNGLNLLWFSFPYVTVIYLCRTHAEDWLTALLIAAWLSCSLWVYADGSTYPTHVLLTLTVFLLPALTLVLLSRGTRNTRRFLFVAWLGAPLIAVAMGWIHIFFVPISVGVFLVVALTIALLSGTRVGHWLPSLSVLTWLGLFLWAYAVGPTVGP